MIEFWLIFLISHFLSGDNMERRRILGTLISIFVVIALNILSGVVAKNIVHDHLLIQILLMVYFLIGVLLCMIFNKLGI
jgi:hypothetical protein